jgi:hypothetical protein
MSSQRQGAPVLTWDSPRDTGGNRVPDAQRNIRYGWLSALDAKDTQDLCRRSQTGLKRLERSDNSQSNKAGLHNNSRNVTAPPMHGRTADKVVPGSMPPSSKEPAREAASEVALLNADLLERTRYIVSYISLSFAEVDAKLDAIILGQEEGAQFPGSLEFATNCSIALGRVSQDWRRIARENWGIEDELTQKLPGVASLNGARTALAELIQILLVEGALLFGRAEFEMMDRVRHLVEACIAVAQGAQQIEGAMSNAGPPLPVTCR